MERYTVNFPNGTKKKLEKRAKQRKCIHFDGKANIGEYIRNRILIDIMEGQSIGDSNEFIGFKK